MGLKRKTISGVLWTSVFSVSQSLFKFIGMIVLARMLSPNEFGLVSMVLIFLGYSRILIDGGFGAAIIQKKDIVDLDLSSVFWLNFFLGVLLTLSAYLLAPLIAQFYNKPELIILTKYLSLIFLFNSMNVVQRTYLLRQMKFKKLGLLNFLGVFLSISFAVMIAYLGYGIWALVALEISQSAIYALLFFIASGWKPKFQFSFTSIKKLYKFSINVLGIKTVNYISQKVDKLLIGKMLNENALGIYSRSFATVKNPATNISAIFRKVLFSTFSKIQDNTALLRRYYITFIKGILIISMPAVTIAFLLSDDIILFLFTSKWIEMIPIFQIFTFLALLIPVNMISNRLILARGKSKLIFNINLIGKILMVIAVVLAVPYGIYYIALVYTLMYFIISIPLIYFALKEIELTILNFIQHIFKLIFSNVLPVILFLGFENLSILKDSSSFIRILFFTILMVGTYLLLNYKEVLSLKKILNNR